MWLWCARRPKSRRTLYSSLRKMAFKTSRRRREEARKKDPSTPLRSAQDDSAGEGRANQGVGPCSAGVTKKAKALVKEQGSYAAVDRGGHADFRGGALTAGVETTTIRVR